jgi:hypothetical protein
MMKTNLKALLANLLISGFFCGCGGGGKDDSTIAAWKELESAAATDPNLFTSGLSGVAVTKPMGWRSVRNKEIVRIRENVQFAQKKFQGLIRKAQLPIVSIMKYPATHQGVNPTVQIGLCSKSRYPSTNPLKILRKIVASMKSTDVVPDLKIIQDVQSLKIDGNPAAVITFEFTLHQKSGHRHSVLSRLYYAVSSDKVLIVGMSGPSAGADKGEDDFVKILQSLRFAK